MNSVASHAGIFRGARISSLPTNACSNENNITFPLCYLRGKWSIDRLNTTHKLVKVLKCDPRVTHLTSCLSFAKVMQCMEYSKLWPSLTFAALIVTLTRGYKAFPLFHADRVIIGLPCSQGQFSRIWKVQCRLAKLGKRMLFSVEQVFVGRDEIRAPIKTPAWEAMKSRLLSSFLPTWACSLKVGWKLCWSQILGISSVTGQNHSFCFILC